MQITVPIQGDGHTISRRTRLNNIWYHLALVGLSFWCSGWEGVSVSCIYKICIKFCTQYRWYKLYKHMFFQLFPLCPTWSYGSHLLAVFSKCVQNVMSAFVYALCWVSCAELIFTCHFLVFCCYMVIRSTKSCPISLAMAPASPESRWREQERKSHLDVR